MIIVFLTVQVTTAIKKNIYIFLLVEGRNYIFIIIFLHVCTLNKINYVIISHRIQSISPHNHMRCFKHKN